MIDEGKKIAELIGTGIAQPKLISLNLALPIVDRVFHITGTTIGIWDAPNAVDLIYIRFNERSAQAIPMRQQKVLVVPFNKVFITVPGGLAGNMEILYGSGTQEFFRMYPNVAKATSILEQVRDELRGDLVYKTFASVGVGVAAVEVLPANQYRKGLIVQADPLNPNPIYLGFTALVNVGNCFVELTALGVTEAFKITDFRGSIWAISNLAGQSVNTGEW